MIHKKVLKFILLMCLGLIVNITVYFIPGINKIISCVFSIVIMTFIMSTSAYKAWRNNDIFQPIMIINIFLLFIFVLRPIQLLMVDDLSELLYFRYYYLIYGSNLIAEPQIAKALLIGLLGVISINSGYWISRNKTKNNKLQVSLFIKEDKRKKNAKLWLNVFIGFSALVLIYYIYKSFWTGNNIIYSTKDILWIYIFCVVVLIEQIIMKKISFRIWIILIVSILAFSILGNRQHIINLMLCVFIPYYYISETKISKRIIFLGVSMILVVVWYGSIRRGNTFALNIVIDSLLSEFSMFDMLVLGIDHKVRVNNELYYGYNYLCFLNYMVPTVNIEFFDFRHVQDVFKGLIGGGIPTSIIGSLYFNFSYIGTIIGSYIMGIFVGGRYNKYVNMEKPFAIAYYSIFLTFVYDLTRVGDIGREIINYLILFGCFKIAMFFIYKVDLT